MRYVTVSMPDAMHEALKAHAVAERRSVSQVVRFLVEAFLEGKEEAVEKAVKTKEKAR